MDDRANAEMASGDPKRWAQQNYRLVSSLVQSARRHLEHKRIDVAVMLARMAATMARRRYTGWYCLPELEGLLCELAGHLPADGVRGAVSTMASSTGVTRQVLHVLTRSRSVGGHSRVIANWMQLDTTSSHTLAFTDPAGMGAHSELARRAASVRVLEGATLQRAAQLRALATPMDAVILSTHEDDIVPSLAFGLPRNRPPVVVFNHADHAFWTGAAVADYVLSIRPSGRKLVRSRRGLSARQSGEIPVPLTTPLNQVCRREARSVLNLGIQDVVLVTLAQPYKYFPIAGQDIIALTQPVLERSRVVLLAIGPNQSHSPWNRAIERFPGRVRAVGIQPRPGVYLSAGDIYLDSFPIPSITSALESGLRGLPVMSMAFRDRDWPEVGIQDDPALCDSVFHEQAAYLDRLNLLIEAPGVRAAEAQRVRSAVERAHVAADWERIFSTVYTLARREAGRRVSATELQPQAGDDRDLMAQWFLAQHEERPALRYKSEGKVRGVVAAEVDALLQRLDEVLLGNATAGIEAFPTAERLTAATRRELSQ